MKNYFRTLLKSAISQKTIRLLSGEELTNIKLPVEGIVPSWLRGSLVRNCTLPLLSEDKNSAHLFDGIAMLHAFRFEEGEVSYSSRFLKSEAFANVLKSDIDFHEKNFDVEKMKGIQDAGVNVFKYNKDFVALTEVPLPVRFDIKTLETLGNFEFTDDLPKKRIFESAHPHYCARTKQMFNFLVEYGPRTQYVFYRLDENKKRVVIAKLPVKKPSYIHSFSMTRNYLVLVEYPLLVNPLRLLFARVSSFATFIRLFKWQPQLGTRFFIVEKATGKLLLETRTNAFFSFHHANAYEEGENVVVDLAAQSFSKLDRIFPQSRGTEETLQGLQRFTINLKDKTLNHENVLATGLDFPRIPDALDGERYRYLYMIGYEGKSTALIKYDWDEKSKRAFTMSNGKIIEPVFVPAPHAKHEDDGVLLTVTSDEKANQCHLMVLDARDLSVLAKMRLPTMLPNTFHGQFFPGEGE